MSGMSTIQAAEANSTVIPTQTAVCPLPEKDVASVESANSANSTNPAGLAGGASAGAPADPDLTEEDEKNTKWTVERGSATVRIYLTPHGDEKFYTVSYWLHKKRYRNVFPSLKKAKAFATTKAEQMDVGDHGVAKLTNEDSAAYLRAIALLKPSGTPLEFAAAEYAAAIKRLGPVSLSQAVDFYLKRHPVHLEPKMVPEVVEEMINLKKADQLSERYIQQLDYAMKRFTNRFCNRLADVSGTEVDAWLRELKVGPRTRNNLRNSVQALCNFAISRKYLPKDHDEIDAVPLAKDRGGEIEIFTPGELQEVLGVAKPEHIPFLAISAFAGVRHAELQRMVWANVNQKAKIIEIKAGMAKTASRRVIPIQPNLAKWLKPYAQAEGPVCHYANMVDEIGDLTRRVNAARQKKAAGKRNPAPVAEFKWKHNALRHSYISYRVAVLKNMAEVALEAGNSPGMIFKHYHELVRPDAAKAWFAIVPAPLAAGAA